MVNQFPPSPAATTSVGPGVYPPRTLYTGINKYMFTFVFFCLFKLKWHFPIITLPFLLSACYSFVLMYQNFLGSSLPFRAFGPT